MPCNYRLPCCYYPLEDFSLNFFLFNEVYSGTYRVFHTEKFEPPPDVARQEPADFPENVADYIALMAVHEEQFFVCFGIFQYKAFMHLYTGEKAFISVCASVVELFHVLLYKARVFFYHVMVTENHVQAVLGIKFMEKPENITVDIADI